MHDKCAATLHMSVFNPEHTLHPPGHAVHMSGVGDNSLLPVSHTKLNLLESDSRMKGHGARAAALLVLCCKKIPAQAAFVIISGRQPLLAYVKVRHSRSLCTDLCVLHTITMSTAL